MSQFAFLQPEWAAPFESASQAEATVQGPAIRGPIPHLQYNDIFVLIGEDPHVPPWPSVFDGRDSCAR